MDKDKKNFRNKLSFAGFDPFKKKFRAKGDEIRIKRCKRVVETNMCTDPKNMEVPLPQDLYTYLLVEPKRWYRYPDMPVEPKRWYR